MIRQWIIVLAVVLSGWLNEGYGLECRWANVQGYSFKQCREIGTFPKQYWLCNHQDFIDQDGKHHDHTVCRVLDMEDDIDV